MEVIKSMEKLGTLVLEKAQNLVDQIDLQIAEGRDFSQLEANAIRDRIEELQKFIERRKNLDRRASNTIAVRGAYVRRIHQTA